MRTMLALVVTFLAALPVRSQTFLYVSMAPEQKIQIYRLDPSDGKLTAVDTVAVEGTPGALGVDPQKKFLFASLRSASTLASFRIDPATGKLKQLSTAALGKDENAAFVGTDRTGRWLLSASYAAGKVVVHRLGDDGAIQSPAVQTIETTKTAHSTLTDPSNSFVFVPHVAPNAVYQFRLDAKSGQLTDAGKAAGRVAPKTGPRHLAFHPKQNLAFTSDEEGSSITGYRFDKETGLTAYQTLSTLPADFSGKNTTAEVKVHPSGKFVWVSNRGHDSLAGFAIDPKNGNLTALGQTPTEKTPRSFEIDPEGKYLFGAGEGTGKLAVYRIDANSGKLSPAHTVDVGKSLTWVLAVKQEGKKPAPKKTTFTDAKEAGLEFAIQGEYVIDSGNLGCQVIALGNGAFQAVVLPGGLPGDGWEGAKILMDGKLNGERVEFIPTAGKRRYMAGNPLEFSATAMFPPKGHREYTAVLTGGKLTLTTDKGRTITLKKGTRVSPTLDAKPPEGALVLFDGTNASEWKEGKIVDGLLPVEANTKRKFKDFKLHLEFRTPFQPTARDQGRGNSGVYLHGQHEIQVLDSFGLEGKNNECGGFYGRKEPKVNMCYPPLSWQTFDVQWKTEPSDLKSKKAIARVTVQHNGVIIHEGLDYPASQGHIHLQNHGNPVVYRNIWVVELK
jgi:6-phosphogluconolactonase